MDILEGMRTDDSKIYAVIRMAGAHAPTEVIIEMTGLNPHTVRKIVKARSEEIRKEQQAKDEREIHDFILLYGLADNLLIEIGDISPFMISFFHPRISYLFTMSSIKM